MEKVRTQPLIIVSLIISLITMGLYGYQNFDNQQTDYEIVFTVLFFFLMGLAIIALK